MIDCMNAPRVTLEDIEANIASEHYFTAADGVDGAGIAARRAINRQMRVTLVSLDDDVPIEETALVTLCHVTFCTLVLRNGTKIVGINYGPVSPESFNAEQGREEARANAVEQVWPLMGYALRDKLASHPVPLTPPPDCPHAAPFRYCAECVADPCPCGLGKK